MSLSYVVKYKTRDSLWWETINHVRADGIMTDQTMTPIRYFITSFEERVEVPIEHTQFYFSRERFLIIKEQMEQETGFEIKVKS